MLPKWMHGRLVLMPGWHANVPPRGIAHGGSLTLLFACAAAMPCTRQRSIKGQWRSSRFRLAVGPHTCVPCAVKRTNHDNARLNTSRRLPPPPTYLHQAELLARERDVAPVAALALDGVAVRAPARVAVLLLAARVVGQACANQEHRLMVSLLEPRTHVLARPARTKNSPGLNHGYVIDELERRSTRFRVPIYAHDASQHHVGPHHAQTSQRYQ